MWGYSSIFNKITAISILLILTISAMYLFNLSIRCNMNIFAVFNHKGFSRTKSSACGRKTHLLIRYFISNSALWNMKDWSVDCRNFIKYSYLTYTYCQELHEIDVFYFAGIFLCEIFIKFTLLSCDSTKALNRRFTWNIRRCVLHEVSLWCNSLKILLRNFVHASENIRGLSFFYECIKNCA